MAKLIESCTARSQGCNLTPKSIPQKEGISNASVDGLALGKVEKGLPRIVDIVPPIQLADTKEIVPCIEQTLLGEGHD